MKPAIMLQEAINALMTDLHADDLAVSRENDEHSDNNSSDQMH